MVLYVVLPVCVPGLRHLVQHTHTHNWQTTHGYPILLLVARGSLVSHAPSFELLISTDFGPQTNRKIQKKQPWGPLSFSDISLNISLERSTENPDNGFCKKRRNSKNKKIQKFEKSIKCTRYNMVFFFLIFFSPILNPVPIFINCIPHSTNKSAEVLWTAHEISVNVSNVYILCLIHKASYIYGQIGTRIVYLMSTIYHLYLSGLLEMWWAFHEIITIQKKKKKKTE